MSIFTAKSLHAATEAAVNAAQAAAEAAQTAAEAAKGAAEGALANESVSLAKLSATLLGPAANVFGLRKLGNGALEATPGNDARLSDERTPTNASVTLAKTAVSLQEPAANVFGLRKIGTGALEARAGNATTLRTMFVEYAIEQEVEKKRYGPILLPKPQAGESWKLTEVVVLQTKGTTTFTIEKGTSPLSVGAPFANITSSGSVQPISGSVNLTEHDLLWVNATTLTGTEPEGLFVSFGIQGVA